MGSFPHFLWMLLETLFSLLMSELKGFFRSIFRSCQCSLLGFWLPWVQAREYWRERSGRLTTSLMVLKFGSFPQSTYAYLPFMIDTCSMYLPPCISLLSRFYNSSQWEKQGYLLYLIWNQYLSYFSLFTLCLAQGLVHGRNLNKVNGWMKEWTNRSCMIYL